MKRDWMGGLLKGATVCAYLAVVVMGMHASLLAVRAELRSIIKDACNCRCQEQ